MSAYNFNGVGRARVAKFTGTRHEEMRAKARKLQREIDAMKLNPGVTGHTPQEREDIQNRIRAALQWRAAPPHNRRPEG